MKLPDLVFTGFNRRVSALNRNTGEIVWQWKAPQGSSYITLMLDEDVLIVSVAGYMYGLEALTGMQRWFNPMKGCGTGVASLASVNGSAQNVVAASAAHAAAAAAATAAQQTHHGG